jgi:hypothetical protein
VTGHFSGVEFRQKFIGASHLVGIGWVESEDGPPRKFGVSVTANIHPNPPQLPTRGTREGPMLRPGIDQDVIANGLKLFLADRVNLAVLTANNKSGFARHHWPPFWQNVLAV